MDILKTELRPITIFNQDVLRPDQKIKFIYHYPYNKEIYDWGYGEINCVEDNSLNVLYKSECHLCRNYLTNELEKPDCEFIIDAEMIQSGIVKIELI